MPVKDDVILERADSRRSKPRLIDCDVHQRERAISDLFPYMPKRWSDYITDTGFDWKNNQIYPRIVGGGVRTDARPDRGGPAGSDLELLRKQLLDEYTVNTAILTGPAHENATLLPNPDFAAVLCSAYNDYLLAEWLAKDKRFRGSMIAPVQDPPQAVKEIERFGIHPDVVQLLLPSGSRSPYGQRQYWPVYEAAAELGLVIGIHVTGPGGWSGLPPTVAGWPTFYLELHTGFPQSFMANVVSLICEGVFVRFPKLRITLIESGFAWVPGVLWRLDKNYKSMRAEVPWLDRLPSEYFWEHFRITTQPIEEAPTETESAAMFEMARCENTLMFASDYPHWDFDNPDMAIPRHVTPEGRAKILGDNARDWYKLM